MEQPLAERPAKRGDRSRSDNDGRRSRKDPRTLGSPRASGADSSMPPRLGPMACEPLAPVLDASQDTTDETLMALCASVELAQRK